MNPNQKKNILLLLLLFSSGEEGEGGGEMPRVCFTKNPNLIFFVCVWGGCGGGLGRA